jgi:hypothetical protein
MLRTLEAKRLAAMESSVNLPARSPKGGGAQQTTSTSSQLKVRISFLNSISFFFKTYLFIICKYIIAVFRHSRRGCQISLQMVVSHHVVAWDLNSGPSEE